MYEERKIAAIHDGDCDVPTIQGGTHLPANPSSLSSSQPSYRAWKYQPVISDGTVVTSDLMVNSTIDDIYSYIPFDTFIQPGILPCTSTPHDLDDISLKVLQDMEAPRFPYVYPHDSRHSPPPLQYDMLTRSDPMGGYKLSDKLTADDFSHADTPYPTPMSPTVQGYPPEDVMGSFLSSQSHQSLSIPSQSTPSPRLESNARPRHGVPVSRKMYMGGASRYHYATTRHHRLPPVQPYENSSGHSDVMFSTLLPYETLANKTRRLQHSSQRYIQRGRQYGSRELFKLDRSLAYDARLYPPPEPTHDKGQDTTSFFSAPDSQNNNSPHDHQVTLASGKCSDGDPTPMPHMDRASAQLQDPTLPPPATPVGQAGVVASPLSLYPPDTVVDETWLPPPGLPGHLPAHHLRGQAPPATTPTSAEENIIASSLTFPNGQYNSLLQRSIASDGSTRSFPAVIFTGTHIDPSYRQYPDQALNDIAASASSTPSTWGSVYSADWIDLDPRPNDTWLPHVGTQNRVSDRLLPSHTPPELGEAPPATLHPTGKGATVAFPALVEEKRDNSSSIHPTALSAQGRLEDVVGPSSPLTNKALLRLLRLIVESEFIRTHEMEPIITSDEGQTLLRQIQSIPDCPPNVFQMSKCSIFTLFVVAHLKFRCLICGSSKPSMVRGVGCVRSHLNHRPYPCHNEGGCDTCPKDRVVKRFFTASLLHDHCTRQDRETVCTSCGVILTSSMKRHWVAKHPDTAFPYEDYPNYRRE